MANREDPILVVGGGVLGVCTAYYLVRGGAQVVLLERTELGAGASSGNAGAVAPGHGPMTKPGRLLQAIRWMGDPTSPLYVPPRIDPSLLRWFWTFHRFCTEEHVHRSMETLGPLGHESRGLFDELMGEESLDCHFRPDGYYEVYRTPEALRGAEGEIPLQKAHGYTTRSVRGEELREREPHLREGTVGGVFFPESATLDPMRFLEELARCASDRGLEMRRSSEVTSIVKEGTRAGGVELSTGEVVRGSAVVLCTGAYSLGLARAGGLRLPIQPAKGYHQDFAESSGSVPALSITCMLGERFVFCTPLGGFLRLAGTLEMSGLNHAIRPRRLENLSESADQYMDGFVTPESNDDWVGLRPCTPDGLPVAGPAPGLEGLWVANGHAMLGLTLGPITGKLLADWILQGKEPPELLPLAPDRFG